MPEDQRLLSNHERPKTLAETIYYFAHPKLRQELEEFRMEYEAIHGETDLTLRYTSTWPQPQQTWMIENNVKRYFDGLPPFVKAYLQGKIQLAARSGNLDDMPPHYVRLFVSGDMQFEDQPD